MKLNKVIYAILAAVLAVVSACSDAPDPMSRAVLASADVLEFETQGAESKIIRVTSDGDWVCECPDWVSVSPATGHAGQTEVTVTVLDNMRDGAADLPRKADVLFKGRNLASIATVLVRQQGDKFRNPQEYTVDQMEQTDDETVVRLTNLTVTTLSANGFVATDGSRHVYVRNAAQPVNVGAKLNVTGVKLSSEIKMPYVTGDRIEVIGQGEYKAPAAADISGQLDSYRGAPYSYISVTGEFDGAGVVVDGQTNKAVMLDAHASADLSKLNGHKLTVSGYYAGTAAPVLKLIPAEVKDLGTVSIVYFSEDFEWLAPWAAAGDAADIVGCDQAVTTQPQITKAIVDGVSAEKALLDRGYSFMRYDKNGPNAGECIYLQSNYLKFGKTGFQGAVTLPAMPLLGAGVSAPTLSFDWYSQRQGSGVFDPTEIVVIVTNGADETRFPVPALNFAEGAKAAWTRVDIKMTGLTLTKDTRITIRNIDSQLTSAKALRWHIDNIVLSKSK